MRSASRELGEILIERKVLDRDRLEAMLEREASEGVELAKLLIGDRLVSEHDLVAAIAQQAGYPFWDPQRTPVQPLVAGMLTAPLARTYGALAIGVDGDRLLVAMRDPSDSTSLQALEADTGWKVSPLLAAPRDLSQAIIAVYGPSLEDEQQASQEEEGPHPLHLNTLLQEMMALGASDLHLSAGREPCVRVDGTIRPLDGHDPLTGSELRELVYGILSQKHRERFEAEKELDTSHSVPALGRFRLNVFQQRDSVGAVLRAIPYQIRPLPELGIPPVVETFASLPRGLVLVTGPTGSGKSTTLASIIDLINANRAMHIMSVEDPIEFLHTHKRSVVNQREVGEDTHSFSEALRHVLRQDPDVILVGEMRDLETISAALTAAETGHLVFGTLHTQDAPQSIDRIIDVFPAHQQQQIRVQLAAALQAVVTQQLLPRPSGGGRSIAVEVLVATSAVRNLIREGKVHQIYSMMQAGGQYGMQTMDQSLAQLVKDGGVAMEVALERAANPEDIRRLAGYAR